MITDVFIIYLMSNSQYNSNLLAKPTQEIQFTSTIKPNNIQY